MSKSKYGSVLGMAHAVDVLIFLETKDDRIYITELQKGVTSNYVTVQNVVNQLIKSGLIDMETIMNPRVAYRVILTKKGRSVASKMKEAEQIIISQ